MANRGKIIVALVVVFGGLMLAGCAMETPIEMHFAIQNNDLDAVRNIVEENPKSVNSIDTTFGERFNIFIGNPNFTPLHYSVSIESCSDEIVQYLIDNGANVNARSSTDGTTPLFHAVYSARKETVKLLLENGAKVNIKNNAGDTPLERAIVKRKACQYELIEHRLKTSEDYKKSKELFEAYEDIVELLQIYSGSREQFFKALKAGDTATVKLMLKVKPKLIKAKETDLDSDKDSPLHHAVQKNHKEIAQLLIAEGAKVNGKGSWGCTPLQYADKVLAELLIVNGADVNAKDNDGYTPLRRAMNRGDKELIDLLRKHGAVE